MYLLDANVLMTANNTYYPIHVVPEFWAWLAHQCATGHVKMPIAQVPHLLTQVFDFPSPGLAEMPLQRLWRPEIEGLEQAELLRRGLAHA